jgi:DNA polymerase V
MKIITLAVDRPSVEIPMYGSRVRAGFPSPADDYLERPLDLNEHLIKRPAATYFVRAQGDSMQQLGIYDGDLLVVDRSIEAGHGNVIIAAVEGELTCKVLDTKYRRLLSGNDLYPPIECSADMEWVSEGVVVASVRYHHVLPG